MEKVNEEFHGISHNKVTSITNKICNHIGITTAFGGNYSIGFVSSLYIVSTCIRENRKEKMKLDRNIVT